MRKFCLRNHCSLLVALFASLLLTAACSTTPNYLNASGPILYPAAVSPRLERVAVLLTITNRSTDDLQVNPTDFVARDSEHRIYPSNPTATGGDANLVRLATGPRLEVLPLPTVTLRQADVLSGFVVFDVPAGVRPVELIWRQSDSDRVAPLSAVS